MSAIFEIGPAARGLVGRSNNGNPRPSILYLNLLTLIRQIRRMLFHWPVNYDGRVIAT